MLHLRNRTYFSTYFYGTIHNGVKLPKSEILKTTDLCFRCGKGGHWASSCPSRQDQNNDFLVFYQCEFDQSEQGLEDPSCIQGKLRANFLFWRDVVRASEFVLDIIQNGYTILFRESPLPYSIENQSSALHQRRFVQGAISELLTRGCIREASVYPQFCNPLHVAVQSSGKLSS